jgi:hypothetical protein
MPFGRRAIFSVIAQVAVKAVIALVPVAEEQLL